MLYHAGTVLVFLHASHAMVRLVLPSVILWAVDRCWRVWNRRRGFEASLEPVPGNATRVVVKAKGAVAWRPGQWAYLSFGGVGGLGAWELHPFSLVASRPGASPLTVYCSSSRVLSHCFRHSFARKGRSVPPPTLTPAPWSPDFKGDLEFIITAAGSENSFTRRLRTAAVAGSKEGAGAGSGSGPVVGRVWVDGPYGELGLRPADYRIVLFVAGGIGVTPLVRACTHRVDCGRCHVRASIDADALLLVSSLVHFHRRRLQPSASPGRALGCSFGQIEIKQPFRRTSLSFSR